jgi:hypothetical protein
MRPCTHDGALGVEGLLTNGCSWCTLQFEPQPDIEARLPAAIATMTPPMKPCIRVCVTLSTLLFGAPPGPFQIKSTTQYPALAVASMSICERGSISDAVASIDSPQDPIAIHTNWLSNSHLGSPASTFHTSRTTQDIARWAAAVRDAACGNN